MLSQQLGGLENVAIIDDEHNTVIPAVEGSPCDVPTTTPADDRVLKGILKAVEILSLHFQKFWN